MSCILLTGATGLIGSFILRELLGQGLSVAVLARGPKARERLERHLVRLEASGQVTVLEGDLGQVDLGLQPEARKWLANHCGRVLNCAGAVKFHADGTGEPYRTNLDGTRHLLHLCRQLKIQEFHHVSTAYVCGQRRGPVCQEELDEGQSFSNDYERSKFLSEVLVRQTEDIPVRNIYRPSVVLGEAATGFTPGFQGAYALLLAGWLKVQQGVGLDQFLSLLHLRREDSINLVTADWVAQAILHHLLRPAQGLHCFHLTHPRPTRWADLYQALLDCAPSAAFIGSDSLESNGLLEAYASYFCNHPEFVPGQYASDCPALDLAVLVRYPIERAFLVEEEQPVDQLVAQLPPCSYPVTLEIAGQGRWALGGAPDQPGLANAFCSGRTFHLLRQGRLSLEAALYSGQLLLEGEEFDKVRTCLAQVLQP
ncbi:SDR family oxidoreductase [bacterium]|nr:SDR family oxidoreductase [bacterium]